jgi:aldose 1-epimerase
MALETARIRDEQSGAEAQLLVGLGLNCFSFQLPDPSGRPWEVLWAADRFADGAERPSGSGIPLLFPFPGRIRGTQFDYRGASYTLEEGDGRGNAIHGFVYNRPWQIVQQQPARLVADFHASRDDARLQQLWPADFHITAEYEVAGSCLRSRFTIENPDDKPLPFGFGTHPYFRLPLGEGPAEQHVVQVPVGQQWKLEEMLPTGEYETTGKARQLAEGLPLDGTEFDDVFGGLETEQGQAVAELRNPAGGGRFHLKFDGVFPFAVVYTPQHRQAVCIEPYTCLPDAINQAQRGIEMGLRELQPGDSFTAHVEMRVLW